MNRYNCSVVCKTWMLSCTLWHVVKYRDPCLWWKVPILEYLLHIRTYTSILSICEHRYRWTYVAIELIREKKSAYCSEIYDSHYMYIFIDFGTIIIPIGNRIGGVMVSVLVSSAIDRGFESRSGQIKDYTIQLVFVASPLSTQR